MAAPEPGNLGSTLTVMQATAEACPDQQDAAVCDVDGDKIPDAVEETVEADGAAAQVQAGADLSVIHQRLNNQLYALPAAAQETVAKTQSAPASVELLRPASAVGSPGARNGGKHAEAIIRLEALWRAWEFPRLDGTTGMSVWWRDHADHRMSVLLSADCPFKGCGPDDGHRSKFAPLPCEEPPAGLF